MALCAAKELRGPGRSELRGELPLQVPAPRPRAGVTVLSAVLRDGREAHESNSELK